MIPSKFYVPHLSPDAEIKYLQSLVNFIPVTISARTRNFHLHQTQTYHLTCVDVCLSVFLLPECPNMVATHSPVLNSKMLMFLPEQLVATYWPDGSSCTCENKRGRKESTLCANIGKGKSQRRYPDQASILAQRSLVELLLFATVDVKNPALQSKALPSPAHKRYHFSWNKPGKTHT